MNLCFECQLGWLFDVGGGFVCFIFCVFFCFFFCFDRVCDVIEICYQYIDCRLMCILLSIVWIGVLYIDVVFVDFQVILCSVLVELEFLLFVSKDESVLKKLYQFVEDVLSVDEGCVCVQCVLGYVKKIFWLFVDVKVLEN